MTFCKNILILLLLVGMSFGSYFSHDESIQHIPKFGGHIAFVNGVSGSDSNSGETPDQAYLTLLYAESQMAPGDALVIRAI